MSGVFCKVLVKVSLCANNVYVTKPQDGILCYNYRNFTEGRIGISKRIPSIGAGRKMNRDAVTARPSSRKHPGPRHLGDG